METLPSERILQPRDVIHACSSLPKKSTWQRVFSWAVNCQCLFLCNDGFLCRQKVIQNTFLNSKGGSLENVLMNCQRFNIREIERP